jgi:hypothetical protein
MRQLEVVLVALLLLPLALLGTDLPPNVQDSIVRKATGAPKATCGSAMACSVVAAITLSDCRFEPTLNRVVAKATLRLMGTIYYFRGSFRSIAERARDKSVVDQETAIEHEYAFHITPAVNAVASLLTDFEKMTFASVAECMLGGTELSKTVTTAFQSALADTQIAELADGGGSRYRTSRPLAYVDVRTQSTFAPVSTTVQKSKSAMRRSPAESSDSGPVRPQ